MTGRDKAVREVPGFSSPAAGISKTARQTGLERSLAYDGITSKVGFSCYCGARMIHGKKMKGGGGDETVLDPLVETVETGRMQTWQGPC